MRVTSGLLAAGLILGTVSVAHAQNDGWYAGAELGIQKLSDNTLKGVVPSYKATYDWGPEGLLDVGYAFGPLRGALEGGYRTSSLRNVNSVSASGNLNIASLLLNGYYDFQNASPFTPYLGVGVGAANVDASSVRNGATSLYSGSKVVPAFQGIVGVSYKIDNNLSVRGDYRFFDAYNARTSAAVGGSPKASYLDHSLMIGFTWAFGQPEPAPAPVAYAPPPPPPAAPPAPPMVATRPVPPPISNYMVFFDFNKSDIRPDAQQIINQAIATVKRGGVAKIDLVGHTDTSGSVPYNQALSQRRADAVKAALIKGGVSAKEISTVAKGKSSPLVATGDGVKEPQNRRVEILLAK